MKGKAWKALREYVKARDNYTCVTCGRENLEGASAQAGHYIPVGLSGSNSALSWHHLNVHTQCPRCNGPGMGMQEQMGRYINNRYGDFTTDILWGMKKTAGPVKDWERERDFYIELLKALNGAS